MKRPYVLGIGLPKTGTLTLATALNRLGWRALHNHQRGKRIVGRNREAGLPLLAGKHGFTAFSDNPWPNVYQEIDAQYPGTLFIYTVRDTVEWLESRVKHAQRNAGLPGYAGGWIVEYPEQSLQMYAKHDAAVREYFAGRRDWLEFDVCGGDGWDKLCRFLGPHVPRLRVPRTSFPHKNKAEALAKHVKRRQELERKKKEVLRAARTRKTRGTG